MKRRSVAASAIASVVVCALVGVSSAARPPVPALTDPDTYDVQGGALHISYATGGPSGQPTFAYEDARQRLVFRGTDIRKAATDLGTLVTVTIRRTVDSGSTSFTLLVPRVRLDATTASAPISTQGITTILRLSTVPALNRGQVELYTVQALTGTARHAVP